MTLRNFEWRFQVAQISCGVLLLRIVTIGDCLHMRVSFRRFRQRALHWRVRQRIGLLAVFVVETSGRYSLSSLSLRHPNVDAANPVKLDTGRIFHVLGRNIFVCLQTFDLRINDGELVQVGVNVIQAGLAAALQESCLKAEQNQNESQTGSLLNQQNQRDQLEGRSGQIVVH